MSKALRILHGEFGRAMLITLDSSITSHAHRTCQLLFRIDGPDFAVSVRDERNTLGEDGVIMLNAWEPHSYDVSADAPPVTVLVLHIEPAWLKRQDRRFSGSMHPKFFSTPRGVVPTSARPLVEELVDLIAYEAEPETTQVEQLAVELAMALTVKYSDSTRLSSFETLGGIACDARIRKVLSVMRDSVGEPIVVEDLAKLARMSRPHFFHLFKQETQLTPMAYSNMVRMETAIQQISETSDSLLEISQRLGFESPGNFTRFFRMHQGVSPSQYRRSVTLLPCAQPVREAVSGRDWRVADRAPLAAMA